MSLGDESGLGPDPATYAPLGEPGIVPGGLAPDGDLEDDPLRERDGDEPGDGDSGDSGFEQTTTG